MAWVTDTEVPWGPLTTSTRASSCWASRVDDAGAKATFCLRKDTNGCTNAVVHNRKLPIRSSDGESDSYLTFGSVVGEGVLERIQNEFL